MADIITMQPGVSLDQLHRDWRSRAESILNAIPNTWRAPNNTVFEVAVQVNSIHRPSASNNTSLHSVGLACDINICLRKQGSSSGYTAILVGGPKGLKYPNLDSNLEVTFRGATFKVKDLYKSTLEVAVLSIRGISNAFRFSERWGGTFKPYDPVHFDAGLRTDVHLNRLGASYHINLKNVDRVHSESIALDEDAGYKSRLDSPKQTSDSDVVTDSPPPEGTTVDNNTNIQKYLDTSHVYIGYDIVISDYSSLYADNMLSEVLAKSGVEAQTIENLNKFVDVVGHDVHDLYKRYAPIRLTLEQSNNILQILASSIVNQLDKIHGVNLKNHPSEIATALVSYLYGKNLNSPQNLEDIKVISNILSNGVEPHLELARYIESQSSWLPSDLRSRRSSEVQLLRNMNSQNVNITGAIRSTKNMNTYSNDEFRDLQLNIKNQKAKAKTFFRNLNPFKDEPASDEYDDSFNDISQMVFDSIALIMQFQQTNTDTHFNNREREYAYRVKTKNTYSILSRKLNRSILSVDSLLKSEHQLKHHVEYSFGKMYSMIPYSSKVAYSVKTNAVKRCEYRIRSLTKKIEDDESMLSRYGIPSIGSMSANLSYMLTSSFILNIPMLVLIPIIQSLLGRLNISRKQLLLERENLIHLKNELDRY